MERSLRTWIGHMQRGKIRDWLFLRCNRNWNN
jgi:hypothetical protein